MAECGTHAITAAGIGACTTGEAPLAVDLIGSLKSGMLLLADRGFYSFSLWNKGSRTGAELLWRIKTNQVLPVDTRLVDGSYLSTVHS